MELNSAILVVATTCIGLLTSGFLVGALGLYLQYTLGNRQTQQLKQIENDLRRQAFEHETRFSRLHEKRAELIAELYKLLVEAETALNKLDAYFERDTVPSQQVYEAVLAEIKAIDAYLRYNCIYLDEEMCNSLSQLGRDLEIVWDSLQITTAEDYAARQQDYEDATRRLPLMKRQVEAEFRQMLGIEDSSTQITRAER